MNADPISIHLRLYFQRLRRTRRCVMIAVPWEPSYTALIF